jgi:hypothetical protein
MKQKIYMILILYGYTLTIFGSVDRVRSDRDRLEEIINEEMNATFCSRYCDNCCTSHDKEHIATCKGTKIVPRPTQFNSRECEAEYNQNRTLILKTLLNKKITYKVCASVCGASGIAPTQYIGYLIMQSIFQKPTNAHVCLAGVCGLFLELYCIYSAGMCYKDKAHIVEQKAYKDILSLNERYSHVALPPTAGESV